MRALLRSAAGVELVRVATPRRLAADEVLVRVLMAGLCRTDCYVAEGQLGPAEGGRILGHELAGIVVDRGAALPPELLGARVSVDPRIRCGACSACAARSPCEAPGFLGVDVDGGFADYVRVPAASLVRVPDGLDARAVAYIEPIAATLAIVGAGIRPEERGLVVGKGRVAALAAAVLRSRGFSGIHTYDPSDPASVERPVAGTFDYAIENGVDRAGMTAIIEALRPRGRVVIKSRRIEPLEIDLLALVPKELHLVAAYYGSFSEAASLVAEGALDLHPLWAEPRPLEDFSAVFEESRLGEGRKLFFAIGAEPAALLELGPCAASSASSR